MKELIVDLFAGGGGASLGIERALGRGPDIAVNHDAAALTMHAANHPGTTHVTEDVWKAKPEALCGGKPVGLLWLSPDCRHFSRAKGGKPCSPRIRSLAWVAIHWAKRVRPRVIVLENVREFRDWGPLLADNKPCPRRKRQTFRRWSSTLRNLGYALEFRVLDAADYGAPTHRRRLFMIARCDGQPIIWPEPSHGDPAKLSQPGLFGAPLQPWRTAAECIDWSIPCPSIFDRAKPLAPKTLKRIAAGLKRYVLDNPKPYIVRVAHGDGAGTTARWGNPTHETGSPLPTVTGSNDFALATPIVAKLRGESNGSPADAPLPTITSGAGAARPAGAAHALGVIAPILAHLTHGGERRAHEATEPLPTVTGANRGEVVLVAPTLAQVGYSERDGQQPRALDIDAPLGTVVGAGKHALVSAFLSQFRGTNAGEGDPTEPIPSLTAGGQHVGVAAALLVRNNHGEKQSSGIEEPAQTVTSQTNKAGLVYAFLSSFYGNDKHGSAADAPLRTATAKDRHGLVIVQVDGVPHVIVDIGLRMLTPRELARAQGFPDSYILTGSKSNQVAKIGNSVCPDVAEAIVAANFGRAAGRATA